MNKSDRFEETINKKIISNFKMAIKKWGEESIQLYPWRYQTDPYSILLSEFMLHRTQARQVVPIYQNFLRNYPNLETFIQSDKEKIRNDLQSLGLSWRINGMIEALSKISQKYGQVPLDFDELCSIHGIGQYIAGATICFSQNQPFTLIDTNVVRVVGRVFGINLKGEARRKNSMVQAISAVVDSDEPRDFYYALIDMAHTICHIRKPTCNNCPLQNIPCHYYKHESSCL
ncbi:MAG: hypothetical protein JEZ06_19430 [Anaerolineaceae bacterium]|nr:hypothetical protein [Anaerolineaceae bacterium]